MHFELVRDFAAVLEAMPRTHPRRRILTLLEEAIRRDVHFLDSRPTALFQCLWNRGWWYDGPRAADHYPQPAEGWVGPPPWECPGAKISDLVEAWRRKKEADGNGYWLMSHRPPEVPLGSGVRLLLRGHSGPVNTVAYSPDGGRIASGSEDGAIRVWDAFTGRELFVLRGHQDAVNSLAFCRDGVHLVSGSKDRNVRIWDAAAGREVRTWTAHASAVNGVASSPDGRLVASASSDGTVKLWDASTGGLVVVLETPTEGRWCLAFSPDGRLLASGGVSRSVRLWDVDSRKVLADLAAADAEADVTYFRVNAVCFSADGTRLAAGMTQARGNEWHTTTTGLVTIWNALSHLPCGGWAVDGQVTSVASSPREPVLAFGILPGTQSVVAEPLGWFNSRVGEDRVLIHNDFTATPRTVFRGYRGTVRCVAFSPDGERLAFGTTEGAVQVWKILSTDPHAAPAVLPGMAGVNTPDTQGFSDVLVSADGSMVTTDELSLTLYGGSTPEVTRRVWSVDTGKEQVESLQKSVTLDPLPSEPRAHLYALTLDKREAIVVDSLTGSHLAYFPVAFVRGCAAESSPVFAGVTSSDLFIFSLKAGSAITSD